MARARRKAGTNRRRSNQPAYNREHGITPQSIVKRQYEGLNAIYEADYVDPEVLAKKEAIQHKAEGALKKDAADLRKRMLAAADGLDFELAARLRDQLLQLEDEALGLS